jgi:hypothetical protein
VHRLSVLLFLSFAVGTDEYCLFHQDIEVADFFDPQYYSLQHVSETRKGESTNSAHYQIVLSQRTMALAEWQEQEAVRQWQRLPPVKNPFHPKALSSLDLHSLGPLLPTTNNNFPLASLSSRITQKVPGIREKKQQQHAELCPLIRTGLDRAFILEQLQKRQRISSSTSATRTTTINSKDAGVALLCHIVPVTEWGKQLQQQQQRAHRKKKARLPASS